MGWETLLRSEDGSHWRTLKSDPAMTGSPMANKDSSLNSVNQPGVELFYSYQFLHSMQLCTMQCLTKIIKKYQRNVFFLYSVRIYFDNFDGLAHNLQFKFLSVSRWKPLLYHLEPVPCTRITKCILSSQCRVAGIHPQPTVFLSNQGWT